VFAIFLECFFKVLRTSTPWHSPDGIEDALPDTMALRIRSKKILIPDVPPRAMRKHQDLVIAGIGVFCATVVIAAVLFVFFGA
jgi:hypothetical protein